MNKFVLATGLTLALNIPALAQDVGIRFDEMKVGTTLVTQVHSTKPFNLWEEYLGKQGKFHVTEVTLVNNDGTRKRSSTSFYDLEGRLVRRDREKGFEEYTPYSCFYVTGDCEHGYQYPNPFKDHKQTKNSGKYSNRLKGDTLFVTWKMINGSVAEVPFKLGPYNLRVSNEYTNALGQLSGFKFVELIEPGDRSAAQKEVDVAENTGTGTISENAAAAGTDEKPSHCRALYEKLDAEATGDISLCKQPVNPPEFDQCQAPAALSAGERPASHVVLALDASGSMAGKVSGERKMKAAKREAERFLRELEKDIPIGLVVYGHRGNNKEDGKQESCAAVEWAHKMGSGRGMVKDAIAGLNPTGWTPLAATLDYLKTELASLKKSNDNENSIPVIYVISDGKETCGGDPVASAKALNESGVRAAVNVIGFDVDEKTRAELEAISEAGGGKYFPAKDSKALRKQLSAARENQAQMARYQYCRNLSEAKVVGAYNNAQNELIACFNREKGKKREDFINARVREFTAEADKACAKDIKMLTYRRGVEDGKLMTKWAREIREEGKLAQEAWRAQSIFSTVPAKK